MCNIFFPGANTGIGKETALDLAKRGARLILLCRNVDKAKKAAEHIKKTHNGAQIAVHQLDLASLKSVRNCAQTLIDTEDKIDILVNNAGEILLEINLLKAFKLELTGYIKQLTYLENKISFLEPPTSLRMVILLD